MCFEGDDGTRNSFGRYYLFFIRPVSLDSHRLSAGEQATCSIEILNLGVNVMIDEAATGGELNIVGVLDFYLRQSPVKFLSSQEFI